MIEAALRRIVGSSLLAIGVFLLGCISYRQLPVATIPAVDFPTIVVIAGLPGANPETMAATVAAPLERRLGRLASVVEITSLNIYGLTQITIQFAFGRDVDGAATDVQAAISAASDELPKEMPSRPVFKKINPVIAPVLILAVTSDTLPPAHVYDFADTVIRQKISQVDGVANVLLHGAAKSAVRVRVDPEALASTGLGLEDIRLAIVNGSARHPVGSLDGRRQWSPITTNDQLGSAADYRPLVIAGQDGAVLRLGDIAAVTDDVVDRRVAGSYNGRPAIFVFVQRKAGANIIDTIARVRAELPVIRQWLPASIDVDVVIDRTDAIQSTLKDAEITFALTAAIVVLLVLIFLRSVPATLIATLSIPISIAGTFFVMAALGYSLDVISLLALTVAVAFVVDDAIVVVENIVRMRESGLPPFEAALRGARQIAFTIFSITASLVAAFAPLLFFPGAIGVLLREFSVTLCTAIIISAIVALTLIPALCARTLSRIGGGAAASPSAAGAGVFAAIARGYSRSLRLALEHGRKVLIATVLVLVATVAMFAAIPKGFLPAQDSGLISGLLEGPPDVSFAAMRERQQEISRIILADPAVESVATLVGSSAVETGGGSASVRIARFFIGLKPIGTREHVSGITARLRESLDRFPGSRIYLRPIEDFNVGAREGKGQYQFTLVGENWPDLDRWGSLLLERLRRLPELRDVGGDHDPSGLQVMLHIDRDKAAKLGISPAMIDDTLYSTFGQRRVAVIYGRTDQFNVVLEINPGEQFETDTLDRVYIRAPDGSQVPLRAVTTATHGVTALTLPHQGEFPAVTLSFNAAPGIALSQMFSRVQREFAELNPPAAVRGSFEGQARAADAFSGSEPYLLLGALFAIYAVLGILYESYLHPFTILSTLPSAALGALLALMIAGLDLSLTAFIAIILLIGIVKKNAILVVDFALNEERHHGLSSRDAIMRACELRLRPILMTNATALLGSVPLMVGTGPGANLRQPLGVAVFGGILLAQLLTLYSTPVIYLYVQQLSRRLGAMRSTQSNVAPMLEENLPRGTLSP